MGIDIKAFNTKQDERTLGSWFYISEPNTYIINTFTNTFLEKAKQSPIKHIYFLHHKTLSDLITNDTQFKHWYNNLKKINIFMNRISAKYLACESTTILNEFKIIKLRHKGIATKDELLKENTIFRLIIDKYLK